MKNKFLLCIIISAVFAAMLNSGVYAKPYNNSVSLMQTSISSAEALIPKSGEILFSQDFTSLTAINEISENWTYSSNSKVTNNTYFLAGKDVNGYVATKNKYITDGQEYSISGKMTMKAGTYIIRFLSDSIYTGEIEQGEKGYAVRYNQTEQTLTLYKDGNSILSKSVGFYYGDKEFKIDVLKSGINVIVGSDSLNYAPSANDYNFDDLKDGYFIISSVLGANVYVYNASAKTINDNFKCNNFILDKSFSSDSDTLESLEKAGYSFTDKNNISIGGHSGGDAREALCINNTGSFIYTGAQFSGNYTVEFSQAYKRSNRWYMYLNYKDAANYYKAVFFKNSYCKIYKCVDGTETELKTIDVTGKMNDTYAYLNLKAVVTQNSDGSVNINIDNGGKASIECTDTNNAFTQGYIGFGFISAGNSALTGYKVYPTNGSITSVDNVKINYVIDGEINDAYKPGKTALRMSNYVLGDNYVIVSVLYENNQMIDIKEIDKTKLIQGDVSLFDTTGKNNATIATYVWSSLNTMKMIMKPCILGDIN